MAKPEHGWTRQPLLPGVLPHRGGEAARREVPHCAQPGSLLRLSSLGAPGQSVTEGGDTVSRAAVGLAPRGAGGAHLKACATGWRAVRNGFPESFFLSRNLLLPDLLARTGLAADGSARREQRRSSDKAR